MKVHVTILSLFVSLHRVIFWGICQNWWSLRWWYDHRIWWKFMWQFCHFLFHPIGWFFWGSAGIGDNLGDGIITNFGDNICDDFATICFTQHGDFFCRSAGNGENWGALERELKLWIETRLARWRLCIINLLIVTNCSVLLKVKCFKILISLRKRIVDVVKNHEMKNFKRISDCQTLWLLRVDNIFQLKTIYLQ